MGAFIAGTKKYEDTGLEQADYKLPGWNHIFNRNFELLNDELLTLAGLVDVEGDYLPDGGVPVWRSARGKWAIRRFS